MYKQLTWDIIQKNALKTRKDTFNFLSINSNFQKNRIDIFNVRSFFKQWYSWRCFVETKQKFKMLHNVQVHVQYFAFIFVQFFVEPLDFSYNQ